MADLTLRPDYIFEVVHEFKTIVSPFENGTEERRKKWSSQRREWVLKYKNKSAADYSTIKTLFLAKYGAALAFTWTNPEDSTDYSVRFKEDRLNVKKTSYGLYDFEFNLLEDK